MMFERYRRMFRLLTYIQSNVRYNVQQLASKFQVSKRTIFRDLNLLREIGIPIEFDDVTDRYSVSPWCNFKSATGLHAQELAALVLSARLSSLRRVTGFSETLDDAVAKLMGAASEQTRTGATHLLDAVSIEQVDTTVPQRAVDMLPTIFAAIQQKKQVRLTLSVRSSEEFSTTKLAPYCLVATAKGWQLMGRSSIHRRICMFALSRIEGIQITDDPYTVPSTFKYPA